MILENIKLRRRKTNLAPATNSFLTSLLLELKQLCNVSGTNLTLILLTWLPNLPIVQALITNITQSILQYNGYYNQY